MVSHSNFWIKDAVSDPDYPGRGIVTRYAFATAGLRALLSSTLAHHALRLPTVHLAVFVDEMGFDATGEQEDVVATYVRKSVWALDAELADELWHCFMGRRW